MSLFASLAKGKSRDNRVERSPLGTGRLRKVRAARSRLGHSWIFQDGIGGGQEVLHRVYP